MMSDRRAPHHDQPPAEADGRPVAAAGLFPAPRPAAERAGLAGGWIAWTAFTLLVGMIYFAAARLGLALVAQPENVAVFWPAAGIAAGLMLALGERALAPTAVAVFLATIAANLVGGAAFSVGILFGLANVAESLVVALTLLRAFGPRFALDHIVRVLAFLAASAGGCAVSASIAVAGLFLLGQARADAITIWSAWFESDAIGVIAVAPLLMGIRAAVAHPPTRFAALEALVILTLLVIGGCWVYLMPIRSGAIPVASPPVVVFPLMLWIAARTPPVFAAAASVTVSGIVVTTMTEGIGRFADPTIPMEERVLAAQLSMFTAAFCALALSALFEERRRTEQKLREQERQLFRALQTGQVFAFEWLGENGRMSRVEMTEDRHGNAAHGGRIDARAWLEAIAPEDRERVVATLSGLTPGRPSYTLTYRYNPKADSTIWLEETGSMEFHPSGDVLRLTGLARDVTERVHADERQRRLIDELNHRVKNVLTLISAVVERSRERYDNVDEYVTVLRGRIGAMTRTHSRLSRSGWSGVGLSDIVADELAPFRKDSDLRISGPAVPLKPEAAQAMTLVLHELATNAAKYGALAPGVAAHVDVEWRLDGARDTAQRLFFSWREIVASGLAEVPGGVQEGYGTTMIRNLLRHELGGTVELKFEASGLVCEITLPKDTVLDTTR